jgi:hypothetical protein
MSICRYLNSKAWIVYEFKGNAVLSFDLRPVFARVLRIKKRITCPHKRAGGVDYLLFDN